MNEQKITIRGLSTAALYAIPAILAVGALLWLAFYSGVVDLIRDDAQQARRIVAVGEDPAHMPKSQIHLKIINSELSWIVIDRAELDGPLLYFYGHNRSDQDAAWIKFEWDVLAADGTVIASHQGWSDVSFSAPGIFHPHQKFEAHTGDNYGSIPMDSRIEAIEIRVAR